MKKFAVAFALVLTLSGTITTVSAIAGMGSPTAYRLSGRY
jgi:hypothetical protein